LSTLDELSKTSTPLRIKLKNAWVKLLQDILKILLDMPRNLTDDRLGSYRFRIGDYRVIFDIEGDEIVVLRVGHRKDIYKRT